MLAAAAFAGGAYAATNDPASGSRQAFLNDVAKRLHVTPAQLNSALKGAALDDLSAAVKEGRITQAQANALKQRIEKSGAPGPLPLEPRGPGGGAPGWGAPPGPGGPPGPGFHRLFGAHPRAHAALTAAATYLGLSDSRLRKQLAGGKSLAQIAKAQGKSTSGLQQALTAAIKARLDRAVANRRITAAQEQEMLGRLSTRIDDLINGKPPADGKLPRTRDRAFGYQRFGGRFGLYGHPGGPRGGRGGPAGFPTAPSPPGPIA